MKYLPTDNNGIWIQCNGYRKKIMLQETDMNCKGTIVQMIEIAPHTSVPFHHHKKMTEVFYFLEGEGYMNINNKEFFLRPGDTLTCEPNEKHNAKNETDSTWKYIVFKTNVEEGDSYWV